MSGIPTEFPSSSPLDLAKVTRTQVQAQIEVDKVAVAALREKHGAAMTETSVEMQAIKALETGIGLLTKVLPLLGVI